MTTNIGSVSEISSDNKVFGAWSPENRDADWEKTRALHVAVRTDKSDGDRYRILAWGFLRGFKYSRMERSHRMTSYDGCARTSVPGNKAELLPYRTIGGKVFYEHNLPSVYVLIKHLAKHIPELESELNGRMVRDDSTVLAWIAAERP